MQSKILSLATLSLLALGASADWDLYSGTCTTGFGNEGEIPWGTYSVGTYDQGACEGCDLDSDFDIDVEFESRNPCDCDEVFTYFPTDDGLDVYSKGQPDVIATCTWSDDIMDACNGGTYACSYAMEISCVSTYCN